MLRASFLAMCLLFSSPLLAQDLRFPSFAFYPQPTIGSEIYISPGSADQYLPSALVDAYAPGSAFRDGYAELKAQLEHQGMAVGFDVVPCVIDMATGYVDNNCGQNTDTAKILLPDASLFFDNHYQGLYDFRQRLEAADPGATDRFNSDFQELSDFIETHEQLIAVLMSLSLPVGAPAADMSALEDLLGRRFFDVELGPLLTMVLEREAVWKPELGPLAVPFGQPERAAHERMRTVRFTALNTGEANVHRIKFALNVDVPYGVLPGAVHCNYPEQNVCESEFTGQPISIELLLSTPEFDQLSYHAFSEVDVELFARTDTPEWQPVAQKQWGMAFGRCDAEFADSKKSLVGTTARLGQARRSILAETNSIDALPGKRLHRPFWSDGKSVGLAQPNDDNDLIGHETVSEVLSGLIENRLTDRFLRKDIHGTEFNRGVDQALFELGQVQQCDRDKLDALYGDLDVAMIGVRTNRAYYQRLYQQAAATSSFWKALAEKGLADFDDGQLFETPDTSGGRQAAEMAGATIAGSLLNVGVGLHLGTSFMEGFGAKANAVGAALVTLQALSASYDYLILEDIEQQLNEAIGWHEASAYFKGMVLRYDRIESELSDIVGRIREIDRKYCTCHRP